MDRRTIYNLFSQWVTHQPNALAVVVEGRSVTYRELDVTANAIMSKFYANEYIAVGIIMSHSTEMISAMLPQSSGCTTACRLHGAGILRENGGDTAQATRKSQ